MRFSYLVFGLGILIIFSSAEKGAAQLIYEQPSEIKNVQSGVVKRFRASVRRGPSKKFKLRGVVVKGTRLPILESQEGPGCDKEKWYKVHEEGWMCGTELKFSSLGPEGTFQPPMGKEITPWPYAFMKESAIEYKWSHLGWLEEIREIFKGFGFGVKEKVTIEGVTYYKTPEKKLIPTYAARVTKRIATFSGKSISREQKWPLGWVNAKKTWVYSEPKISKKLRVRQLLRYDFFVVASEVKVKKRVFFELEGGGYIHSRDVRVASKSPRPKDVKEDEKWIDVDVKSQIMTAYIGDEPVYVTLVSTGRKGASRTVKGEFRVWVKVAAIAMDNTDEEEEVSEEIDTGDTSSVDTGAQERKLYSLQDVPWTQFFHESYGLHGVYWHNRFGNRKSHGCVNLAPIDAKWFYEWTAPHVPKGWWSIYSTKEDKGTLVRVR